MDETEGESATAFVNVDDVENTATLIPKEAGNDISQINKVKHIHVC